MTRWTDERLVALLTDNFAAHEKDADPAVAHRIALTTTPARRSRWPLIAAAAAVVVLIAGITAYAVHAPGLQRPPVADTPTPAVKGGNRALAVAEAARVLSTIPVPPGATRSEAAPARRLDHLVVYAGPVDPSLTRTSWWVVPLSYRDLVAWYDAHSPADVSSAYAPSSSSPEPDGDLYWPIPAHSTSYSEPAAVVAYARLGPNTTAIRTDATLAARYDRTAQTLVPATVTSIDITKSAIDGPAHPPTTATVTDPTLLTRITSAFNDLDGAFANTETQGCGSPVGIVYVYAVTFHWPGHTLAVDPGAALCGIGMGLTLDGTKLPQKLEDVDTLDTTLEDAIHAS